MRTTETVRARAGVLRFVRGSRPVWALGTAAGLILAGIAVIHPGVAGADRADSAVRVEAPSAFRSGCGAPSPYRFVQATAQGTSIPVLPGMGEHKMEVTTRNPLAKVFFDQGLALAYGFNHAEAARSFRRATELDPSCAMAWWGYAIVLGPNYNLPMDPEAVPEAFSASRRALELIDGVTPRELALIEALSHRYAEEQGEDRSALDEAYADAMRKVAARFPEDPDVLALTAEALMNLHPWDFWTPDGRARPWTAEVVGMLESAIALHPGHPGALHMYIHAVEASKNPWVAEEAADRLVGAVPGSGHLVHMPSHLYIRIGRYSDAARVNRLAIEADENYFQICRTEGIYPAAYYPHNIHFLWISAMTLGNQAEAMSSARKLARRVDPAGRKDFQAFLVPPLFTFVRFGMWDEAIKEARPDSDLHYSTGIWLFTNGMAYAAKGDLSGAQSMLDELRVLIKSGTVEDELIFFVNPPVQTLRIAEHLLAGEMARVRGELSEAIARFEIAVRLEDGLAYNEPEDWAIPSRHLLGAALLQAGRPAEAETVFWMDLADHPENGWALAGLDAALAAQGEDRAIDHALARERFTRAWSEADVSISSSRVRDMR